MAHPGYLHGGPAPRTTVNLTEHGGQLEYAEILTPAGIVRVNVGLADTRTGEPVVLVEVQANSRYARHTDPGGHWNIETSRDTGTERLDVRLIREKD